MWVVGASLLMLGFSEKIIGWRAPPIPPPPPHPQWETLPGGIPDEFSAMLIECALKISVNFKLSQMIFPLFSMVIYIFADKKSFVRQKRFDSILT